MHTLFAFILKPTKHYYYYYFRMGINHIFIVHNEFVSERHDSHHVKCDTILKWLLKNKLEHLMHDVSN